MILFDDKKFVYLLFIPFAIKNINKVVTTANMNEIGFNSLKDTEKGNRKNNMAPKPAPADIPSSPDSARLFRNRDCRIIPEQESDAPTNTAFIILGSLISNNIFLFISLLTENKLKISAKDIDELPIINEIIIEIIKIKNKTINIISFLDND